MRKRFTCRPGARNLRFLYLARRWTGSAKRRIQGVCRPGRPGCRAHRRTEPGRRRARPAVDEQRPDRLGDGPGPALGRHDPAGPRPLEAAADHQVVRPRVHGQHHDGRVVGQRPHRRAVAAVADDDARPRHQLVVGHEPVHLDPGRHAQRRGVDVRPGRHHDPGVEPGAPVERVLEPLPHPGVAEGAQAHQHGRLVGHARRPRDDRPHLADRGPRSHDVELGQRRHQTQPPRHGAARPGRSPLARSTTPSGPRSSPW